MIISYESETVFNYCHHNDERIKLFIILYRCQQFVELTVIENFINQGHWQSCSTKLGCRAARAFIIKTSFT